MSAIALTSSFTGGQFTNTNFGQILFQAHTDYKDSYVAVGGFNYLLAGRLRNLTFETEGQLVQHFGIMKHLEINGVLLARLEEPGGLPFSIAFGEGLSWAGKRPRLEESRFNPFKRTFDYQETRPLLNYLVVELETRLPEFLYSSSFRHLEPRVFLRVHHRSGVFGTYCPPICGSNFIAYGIKLRFM